MEGTANVLIFVVVLWHNGRVMSPDRCDASADALLSAGGRRKLNGTNNGEEGWVAMVLRLRVAVQRAMHGCVQRHASTPRPLWKISHGCTWNAWTRAAVFWERPQLGCGSRTSMHKLA
jgi:hypothetical protein